MTSRSVAIAERLVADEADGLDRGDRPFVDLEDDIDAVLRQLDDLRLDRRRESPALPVERQDALHVALHLGPRVDDARL